MPIRITRIYHDCEGGIEKSVLRIAVWLHKAWRVMTNGDREGQIFLSNPHLNYRFIFLLTTKVEKHESLPENPEYHEMRHGDVILTSQ